MMNSNDQTEDEHHYENILTKETTQEEFIEFFNSDAMENERKQVSLKINKLLIDVENEKNKNELKILNQKAQKKNDKLNSLQKEKSQIKTFICDTQLKISQKLTKSKIKNSQALEVINGQLQRGDTLLKKMTSDIPVDQLEIKV